MRSLLHWIHGRTAATTAPMMSRRKTCTPRQYSWRFGSRRSVLVSSATTRLLSSNISEGDSKFSERWLTEGWWLWGLTSVLAVSSTSSTPRQHEHTKCDNDDADDGTATSNITRSHTDDMIDAYLQSLMEDHTLIKLPYNMGTSNAALFHLLGVDKSIVEEAIATLDSTIEGWNREAGSIVGHPIVYVLKIANDENSQRNRGDATVTKQQQVSPLIHHPESRVPWALLEKSVDILWEDARMRGIGIFPEFIEKRLMINTMNVVSAILFDVLLSASISMNRGSVRLSWSIDSERFDKYHEDLANDPEKLRRLVEATLSQIDFDEITRQAKEALRQQEQSEEAQRGQEDVLKALDQLALDSSSSHSSLDNVREKVYEMAFKLMLMLFYWFSVDAEALVLGRSVTQHFVKPKHGVPQTAKTNVTNEAH